MARNAIDVTNRPAELRELANQIRQGYPLLDQESPGDLDEE
jgi:hypothetical protein